MIDIGHRWIENVNLVFVHLLRGNGSQPFLLKIFLEEKLLNVMPTVPVNPITPPHPALNSNWSLDFSTTPKSISTVPSSGLGFGLMLIFSWSKKDNWAISRCERISAARLNFSPVKSLIHV